MPCKCNSRCELRLFIPFLLDQASVNASKTSTSPENVLSHVLTSSQICFTVCVRIWLKGTGIFLNKTEINVSIRLLSDVFNSAVLHIIKAQNEGTSCGRLVNRENTDTHFRLFLGNVQILPEAGVLSKTHVFCCVVLS